MGARNSPEVLQEKTNGLLQGFEYTALYIDDILVITEGGCRYHFNKLELTLNK